MIDKTEIDRLNATPIEAVAERLGLEIYRHRALCPFHDDSRPSLTFNTYTNRYRCFVCDAHGGVIDLVMHLRHCTFPEAIGYLKDPLPGPSPSKGEGGAKGSSGTNGGLPLPLTTYNLQLNPPRPLDLDYLTQLVSFKSLNEPARRFLFDERKIDPRVVDWCGLTSISQPTPCWRYGKPFYDAPSLLVPYYDEDGRLLSVQGRYLGNSNGQSRANGTNGGIPLLPTTYNLPPNEPPRFRFPRGSACHIYGLQILRTLQPGEELWITEGCSDCWAMLSSGKKAIAIPSATLLKDRDLCNLQSAICNLHLSLHMYPDNDAPGERLFLALRSKLPQLQRHQLPKGIKDFGEWWKIIAP